MKTKIIIVLIHDEKAKPYVLHSDKRFHENIIVLKVIQFVAVMKVYGADRTGKDRVFHFVPEEVKTRVRCKTGVNRIHIDADLLPLVIVADRNIADSLGPRSGNVSSACPSVAFRAGLARPHTFSGPVQQFLICHFLSLLECPLPTNGLPRTAQTSVSLPMYGTPNIHQ